MLKLTRVEYQPDSPVWVAVAHISSLQPAPEGGTSVWTGSTSVWVKETAEEIMAMEAMLYHLHPPMLVTGGFSR